MKKMRSIIKYPGSKQLMLESLFKHLPKSGDVLVEPFCGSCAVALNTDYNHYILNDANPDLIALYVRCVKDPDQLIADLKKLFVERHNTPDAYYSLREKYNSLSDHHERASLLMYLCRHGFNGLIRYNQGGTYNVPFGDGKKAYLPEREIYQFSEKFQNADFYCTDFANLIEIASKKDGVKGLYIDPPYLRNKSGKPSFTQYVAQGFSINDHHRINESIMNHRASFDGVFVSNHQSPELEATYVDATRTVKFRVQRTIAANASKRKSVNEVIMYY